MRRGGEGRGAGLSAAADSGTCGSDDSVTAFSGATAPEVATEKWGVHANRLPGGGRTVWTLYNGRYATVRGPVIAVAHSPGATYCDAWNDIPLRPEIVGKRAIISQTLHPQALGCVVQEAKR